MHINFKKCNTAVNLRCFRLSKKPGDYTAKLAIGDTVHLEKHPAIGRSLCI